jgi:hypothetical protein
MEYDLIGEVRDGAHGPRDTQESMA